MFILLTHLQGRYPHLAVHVLYSNYHATDRTKVLSTDTSAPERQLIVKLIYLDCHICNRPLG